MSTEPRRLVVLALLALGPVAAYAIARESIVVLAAISVIIIGFSLYTMLGPSDSGTPAA